MAVAIGTPAGVVLHTGDRSIRRRSTVSTFDFQRFAQLGGAGCAGLHGDSTNVDRKWHQRLRSVMSSTASKQVFTSACGRIVIAMLSSSLDRMQFLVDLVGSGSTGGVAFVGGGVIDNRQIAMRLAICASRRGCRSGQRHHKSHPSQDVVYHLHRREQYASTK